MLCLYVHRVFEGRGTGLRVLFLWLAPDSVHLRGCMAAESCFAYRTPLCHYFYVGDMKCEFTFFLFFEIQNGLGWKGS